MKLPSPWPWAQPRQNGAALTVMVGELVSPRARARLAQRRLRWTLEHARHNVPWLGVLLAQQPADATTDLSRWPLCHGRDLRRLPPLALVARGSDPSRCRSDATSGSSGPRFFVYRDAVDDAIGSAVWMRSYGHMGWRPTHRRVRLRHPDPATEPVSQHGLRRLLGLPAPVELSTTEPIDAQVDTIVRLCPEVIHGSPHELADVCLRLRERHLKLSSPVLVVAAGEPLHADVRDLIEERLGVAPRQVYGSTEVGFVAWECEAGGLHQNSDLVWCEIDEDAEPDTPNLIVTTLTRRVMPLVRFVTGDVVIPATEPRCRCGRSWPVLGDVLGPESSFLELPSGRRVPERAVARAVAPLLSSAEISIEQPSAQKIVVRALAPRVATAAARRALLLALRQCLGDELEVEQLAAVDALPRTRIGKRHLVFRRFPSAGQRD